jgi:hypothetical protein
VIRRHRGPGLVAVLLATLTVAACATGPAAVPEPAPGGPTTATTPTSTAGPSSTAVPSSVVAAAPVAVTTIRVGYTGGRITGGGRVAVERGRAVEIVVTSDAADELHLHGYDLSAQVPAGSSATLRFTADIPGVFELEFHKAHKELLRLQVN